MIGKNFCSSLPHLPYLPYLPHLPHLPHPCPLLAFTRHFRVDRLLVHVATINRKVILFTYYGYNVNVIKT
jgi:hypothetical protein